VNGAFPGAILTSDAVGNATWQPCCAVGGGSGWLLTGNSTICTDFMGSVAGSADPSVRFKFNGGHAGLLGTNANTSWGEYAMGNGACGGSLTGGGNTANGYGALNGLTTGSENTAVGLKSQSGNANRSRNTSVGYASSNANNSGDDNTSVGHSALSSNQSNANTAVGKSSLQNNTQGPANTAIGMESMLANTTGGKNAAVGYNAMNSNTLGGGNTAIGFGSMMSNTTGSGNTVLGASANVSTGNLSNATAIGAGSSVCQSNNLILGTNGVNVGIGNCSANTTLQVNGGMSTKTRVAIATPITIASNDYTVLVSNGATNFTVNLPTTLATGQVDGRIVVIKRTNSTASTTGQIIINAGAGFTIQNFASNAFGLTSTIIAATATANLSATFQFSSATNAWHLLSKM
jgi:hypothetical protein